MEKMPMQSASPQPERLSALEALFPECVTETREPDGTVHRGFDMERLRVLLCAAGADVNNGTQRYTFTWPDKDAAIRLSNLPTTAALRPVEELSRNFWTTHNLYIEGDNLEVLKCMRETYLHRVKMIYIDPPYNTGQDFVYKDNFHQSAAEYEAKSGMRDAEGNIISTANSLSNGRFHTDWLNMLYPRLRLARDFLSYDGVIFISIDDHEVHNLRKICDEVFGEGNFVGCHVWQKKYGPANDATGISATHEFILAYSINNNWKPELIARNNDQLKAFKNPDNDPRGLWRASDMSARTYSANCDYPVTGPNGTIYNPPASRSWVFNKNTYEQLLADNRITFGANGTGRPMVKKFLSEVKGGITPETWLNRDKVGDNKTARYELKDLFPENPFDTPKPSTLIKYFATIATKSDDLIMDFFSGSGTTAHAVMQLNAEDGGQRRFILVQLPEATPADSEARQAGYKTICEIGRERVRRAGDKIQATSPLTTLSLDIGYRVLRLDTSNMRDVYYTPDKTTQDTLFNYVSNVKPDRTALDLLMQAMLNLNTPLDAAISQETVDGATVYNVAEGHIAGLLAGRATEAVVRHMASLRPTFALFLADTLGSDHGAANVEALFHRLSPDSELRII